MYHYSKIIKSQKAAALGYDEKKDISPKIVATGAGIVAEKIIEIAKENNIPIHKDANLVEILSILDIDEYIPVEVYGVVAEIFTHIYEQNRIRKMRR